MQARAIFDLVPDGQLRDHQGQLRRRQRRLPAQRATRRSSATPSPPATSRSSARRTPTTGTRRSPRPRWSSSSRRPTTTSRPCSPRTTAWPAASSPPSRPRVSPARCPCRARTATSRALNRVALGTQTVDVWKDARLLGQAAGEAAVQLCANPDLTAVDGHRSVHVAGRQRAHVDPPRPDPDHPGQPRRRPRRRLDRPGDAVPGRRARYGPGLRRHRRVRLRPARAAAAAHRAGDHGRLTTLTPSMCLRPAPASWRRTLAQCRRHHDC